MAMPFRGTIDLMAEESRMASQIKWFQKLDETRLTFRCVERHCALRVFSRESAASQ